MPVDMGGSDDDGDGDGGGEYEYDLVDESAEIPMAEATEVVE